MASVKLGLPQREKELGCQAREAVVRLSVGNPKYAVG